MELLIQSFSESPKPGGAAQPDPLPADTHQTYEAAVTMAMRVVFLPLAEERGLLPTGELFEQVTASLGNSTASKPRRSPKRALRSSSSHLPDVAPIVGNEPGRLPRRDVREYGCLPTAVPF